jgi:hypothetical protein
MPTQTHGWLTQQVSHLGVSKVLMFLHCWRAEALHSLLQVLQRAVSAAAGGVSVAAAAAAAGVHAASCCGWQHDSKGVDITDAWQEQAPGQGPTQVHSNQPGAAGGLVGSNNAVQQLLEATRELCCVGISGHVASGRLQGAGLPADWAHRRCCCGYGYCCCLCRSSGPPACHRLVQRMHIDLVLQ